MLPNLHFFGFQQALISLPLALSPTAGLPSTLSPLQVPVIPLPTQLSHFPASSPSWWPASLCCGATRSLLTSIPFTLTPNGATLSLAGLPPPPPSPTPPVTAYYSSGRCLPAAFPSRQAVSAPPLGTPTAIPSPSAGSLSPSHLLSVDLPSCPPPPCSLLASLLLGP